MASDRDVLSHIKGLVDEEHDLRTRHGRDDATDDEQQRLRQLEVELDQCWDLLRQRRALRASGQDPDSAAVRPPDQVEGYLG
ncbi:MAG: DUF2630 family protein [Propionibacteriales bacterium]|nr:DUF2630 family protein [Propionibacteriales bacterium]